MSLGQLSCVTRKFYNIIIVVGLRMSYYDGELSLHGTHMLVM